MLAGSECCGFSKSTRQTNFALDYVKRFVEAIVIIGLYSVSGDLIRKDNMLLSMPNVALALHLLNEKYYPSSFWRPYIGIKIVYSALWPKTANK